VEATEFGKLQAARAESTIEYSFQDENLDDWTGLC